MWYLKVSSSLYIAVALICMIQNAISLTVDQTIEDQWSKLANSTDQIDLKKISKQCKNSINSFNEKLENTKTIVNKKLPEPNKTTEDIEKLIKDVKTQIKNSSADLVNVRQSVQKAALRFRDTFKSLVSFTELDNESVNKELEGIKKTTVDSKKPLVNRVVRSFGNRYDLNKLANRVLEISSDREKLKNNYDEKKKIAKKELNSLWNSLTNHSKTVNDNALKAFESFFEGMKSLKSIKKKVKTIGEDAINEIKKGDDFNNLKNAVELAKALKLKFEDEWNLGSGELSYSEEQKKDTTKTMDENPVEDNKYDNSTNDIESSLPTTEQETIDNEKTNAIPSTQFEIEKPTKDDNLTSDKAVSEVEETQLPTESEDKVQTTKLEPTIKEDLSDHNISDNINSPIEETSIIPNSENKENKEKTIMVESKDSNNETNPTDGIKSDLSNNETTFNPDITNDETLISPNKNAENNKKNKIINKRTSSEKIPILPWQKLIQLDDKQVSQQSKECESLLNNITPDFENIKKSAKNSIQVTKNYKTLQKIENETVQRFYDKMVDTSSKLSNSLVNSAEDVCAKVTPINKRYETKFKNDPNIKRIKYLLGKQYDPNQYILKVLDDASHKTGIGGMKKTTYYKMLAVAHNLNHETKEIDDAALYAMNKIYEGKLAATNLQKMFNKEKASKACYIRNILLEKENNAEKKKKDENKEKVKENINNDINTEPLKPDVNLDSVDDIQPSTINDDNEPTLNNEEEKKTLNDKNESTTHNNLGDNENDNTTDEKENSKKENEEQKTEENYNISSNPQNKDSDSTIQTTNDGANKPKRNITRKVTHHRKHRNPNDPNDVSEEYDTIEEIDDEEDDTNEYKSSENKSNITPEAESLFDSDNKQEVAEPEQSENENGEQKTEVNYNISSIPQNKDSDSTIQTTNDGANKPKRNITRKVTHHRKHRNPNDPNDVSEEYDTIEEIDDEEDDTNEYKSSENKSNITPEAESLFNSDNKKEVEELEESEKENGKSRKESSSHEKTTEEGTSDEINTNQRLTQIDPKEEKEISEEYDEEQDGKKINQPNDNTFGDTEKSESSATADNQDDVKETEKLQNENIESNEENKTSAATSDGDNSGEHKTKRGRKRIDPKAGKYISEENETFEEDEKNLNKSTENQSNDTSEIEPPVNEENKSEQETKEEDTNTDTSVNEDTTQENFSNESLSLDANDKKVDQENTTNETEELDENENLNSIEGAALKSVNNENIIPAAESMGENSTSYESSNESPEQSQLNTSNKQPDKELKDPKSGKQVSEKYDTPEAPEKSKLEKNKIDTTSEKREHIEDEQSSEIPEHDEKPENNQSNEHEPETPTNEVADKPSDISVEDERNKQPNKRHRRRKNPKTGLEVSEEYDTVEEQDEESPLEDDKIDTPEYDENSEEKHSNEHRPETPTNEKADEPSDIGEPNEEVNQPSIKNRRPRRPKKSKNGLENPEDYKTHKQNDESPTGDIENDSPSETREHIEDEQGSEIPEHDEKPENNQSNEHEPETTTNEVADKPSDINVEDEKNKQPNKRHRRRKNPKTGLEVSEEYDTVEEQDEESPLEEDKIDSPEYDENLEEKHSNEHQPETPTNEKADEPSDIGEPNEEVIQPSIKNRRPRRPKKSKNGLENPEDYKTDKQNDESPTGDIENDSPSETREHIEDEQGSEIPEHDEKPENNQSNEHEPETPTNEVADKPSDISVEDERNKQPNKRHRRRKNPKTGQEVSEEYDTLEEQDEESPLEDDKIDTPEYDENSKEKHSNEHQPETPTNEKADELSDIGEPNEEVNQPSIKNRRPRRPKKSKNGLENPEDYKTDKQNDESPTGDIENDSPSETREHIEDEQGSEIPEHDEKPENNQSNEHEPETPTNEVADKPSDISVEDEKNKQPNKRHRRRKNPKTGLEVSEEYDTVEEQDEESPLEDDKIDTPEYDDNSEEKHSNEHQPETPTNEKADEPSDIGEPNEEVIQTSIKNRRPRRPKKTKNGLENPEDYKTNKQNDESPTGDIENDSPSETREHIEDEQGSEIPEHDEKPENNQSNEHEPETPTNEVADKPSDISVEDEKNKQPNKRHRRRKNPKTGLEVSEEYDTVEEQDEESPLEDDKIDTPEYDDNSEEKHSNEHQPETPTNEKADEPSDIGEPNEEVIQTSIKNRRPRRPKKTKNGLENPEDYKTDKQNDESPTGDIENDTPSETREHIEDEQGSEIPEHDEKLENNQSNEHEPETPTNEVADKPSDISVEDEKNKQPNKRHRRRKNPKTGLEVSEEYDTVEEQDEESPLEDDKIDTPEYDENSEEKHSNEHQPETPTNEKADEPSDIGEPNEEVIQTSIKNRRPRRPKKTKNGLENPEDYKTNKQNDESPTGDIENDSPSETREHIEDEQGSEIPEHDEKPENNQSNEHEPETPTNEVADKPSDISVEDEKNKQPNKRHRRRKNPKTGQEVSEEYDTLEEQDEESPLEDDKIDTPEYDENSEEKHSNEHQPETPTNEKADEPSDIGEPNEEVIQTSIKNRRPRRPKKTKNGLENPEDYKTNKQNDESPTGDIENDSPSETREHIEDEQGSEIPEHDEKPENNQSNEHEPETPTNEVADKPSDISVEDEKNKQPNKRHRRRKNPKTGLEVSEEYDTVEEQDEESPLEDDKIDTPEYDENSEEKHSNEHQPETPTNEKADEPSDIGEPNEEVIHTSIKNRRPRRPKKTKNGLENPEDYKTNKQNDESPTGDIENDSPSETREHIEDEQGSEIPEHDEKPENNQSNEHEPETPTNEVADKPSDISVEDEKNKQPNKRHRRRKNPKTGLEMSEEYDTVEEQDEESPLEDDKIDTPEYDENSEEKHSNEHQPETPTNEKADEPSDIGEPNEEVIHTSIKNRRPRRPKKTKNGLENPEDYKTNKQNDESPTGDIENDSPSETREHIEDEQGSEIPEHDEKPENNQSNEHEPETPTNEVADKPSDISVEDEKNKQPNKRHRRRKNPKTGLEMSEEYDTVEEQDEESPLEDDKIDTPEYDENSEEKHSNEHQPETPTNEKADEPSDIGEPNEEVNQPSIKNRRPRRPKKSLNGFEVPEDYKTDKQNDESPTGDIENDSPSETREHIEDEQGSEIPEHDEKPENNQSNEHEPETTTNEEADKPSDISVEDEKNKQPNKRHRRRKNPKTGLEVSEEYDTVEEQDEESPLEDDKIDSPEYDENSEEKHSNEHQLETPTNEKADEPSDIGEPNEEVIQPSIKNRRPRRPKKSKNGFEVPEDYKTDKQNNESPTGDIENDTPSEIREHIEDEQGSEIPEHDEKPENYQSNEHEPETPTNEVADKPSDISVEDKKNKRPNRRRRNPKTGLEVSEEYDTLEEQDEESPLEDDKIDTPEYDENSEEKHSNNVEKKNDQPELSVYPENSNLSSNDSATPSDTDDNENVVKPHPRKIRRRRKSKQPQSSYENDKTPIAVNDENINYHPVEDRDINNNYIPHNNYDELEEDPHNGYGETDDNQSYKNQPELSEYPDNSNLSSNDSATPIDTDDNENVVKPHPRKIRRRRKSKQPQSAYENDKTPMEVNDENIQYHPIDDRDINNNYIPHNNYDELEEDPHNGYGETDDNESYKNQPELSEYPENSNLSSNDSATPIDTDDNENVVKPHPRKIRRRRKSKQPQSAYENDKTPMEVNDENIHYHPFEDRDINNKYIPHNNYDELEEDPHNGYGETDDNEGDKNQPELSEYPENSNLSSNDSATPIDTDDNENVVKPHPRKIRRRRKSKQPQSSYENDKTPIAVNDENINYHPVEDRDINYNYIPHNNYDELEEDPHNGYGETDDSESDKNLPELSEYPDNSNLSSNDSATPSDTDDNENVVKPHPRKIRRRRKSKQPQSSYENDKTPIAVNDENINYHPVEDRDINNNYIPHNNYDELEEDPHNGYGETDDNQSYKNQPELSEYPDNSNLSSNDSATPIDTDDNENVVKPHPRKIRRRRKSKQPQSAYENDKTPMEVNDENIQYHPIDDRDINNNYIPHNNYDELEEDPHNGYGETDDNQSYKNQPELSEYPDNSNLSSNDSATPIDTDDNENVVKPHPRKIRRRRKSKQPQSAYENDKTPMEVNDENIQYHPIDDRDINNNYIPHNNYDELEEDPHNGYGETDDNESYKNQPELSEYPENSNLSSNDSATPIDTDDNENVVKPHLRKIRRRRKSKQPQSAYENDKTPIEVNDENIHYHPFEDRDINNKYIPHNNYDELEEDPHNGYGETDDNESDKNQPELSEYPENSNLSSNDSATPIDTDDNENVVKPHPRKIRRRRKSKQPQSSYENDKTPIEVNDENIHYHPVEDRDINNNYIPHNNYDELEEDPHNGYGETDDNESDKNQPELSEYPENSNLSSKDSATPIDTVDNDNVVKPHPRKIRRRRKSKQPQSAYENYKTPIETNDISTKIIPSNVDTENSRIPNEEKSIETPDMDQKNIQKNPKKKRHIRRIRTYVVNKATNERIPINDQTYSTTDGFPDAINNKLDSLETDDSNVDDPDSNTDRDDYSSFLFKEYNSDQCKRNAYDRFKKVTSQDAKQIAYRSVLDTSEMRSNMLATIKNAIGNVKGSRTFNDVDQSLRTVSYSLKVGLKQTVSDLVIKVIPLAKDFLKTAENLKELYQGGPQSTHKMLTNILKNESTVPESAKDILRLISPQFDVDELINNIFEKPYTAKSLKDKKVKAQRKLIDLSKHMDTAISNIDCFVLSAMSTVGIGADTLKLLKSGKVIMSDKHPRAKILRDAVGIIKAGKKIRNNDDSFTPTLTPLDGTTESDEDDDDEDPDQVAQKNEEFLKTVPDLDDDIPISKKVKNKRQSLGVIVVHPDKQIEYKEVTNTSQLKKFVGDQTKKYKLQSKNKHPKFLKLNSKQLIDAMVADVKKKAERNGMTKKEMVDEIIKNLNSS